MDLWTAFTIGLFGSFHCVGMCGPIAMALPGTHAKPVFRLLEKSLYNFGRIVTYSLMGAVVGLAGRGISLAELQRPLSVLLGLLVIAGALLPYSTGIRRFAPLRNLFGRLQRRLQAVMQQRGFGALFVIGLLNGLLPCGFVYVGLAGSITTGSVPGGMGYMAMFGLGTFPAMMLMGMAPRMISLPVRKRINRIIPILAVLLGVYLVARGLLMPSDFPT